MWVKWMGAFLILGAAAQWGSSQASKLRQRVKQLEEFRLALRLLAAEVGYTATPLPRALAQIGTHLDTVGVRSFFTSVCNRLRESTNSDAASAWLAAATDVQGELSLTAKDWAVIARAAAGLGGLGRDDQIKQLVAAETQLAAHATDAIALCASGEKMWQYLGILSGVALVILLL